MTWRAANRSRSPWEKLNGKPLIYASLGTLVNGLPQLHAAILSAAAQLLDVQIVFSIGANIDPATLGKIPANTLIVPAAPQAELLKRAALCITHAGLNTVQEALQAGVPMVAIPPRVRPVRPAGRHRQNRLPRYQRVRPPR